MKRTLFLVMLVTAVAAEVQAGAQRSYPVTVDLTRRTAWGDLGTARNSTDSVQSIGCAVEAYEGGRSASCEAVDASGHRGYCRTYDPDLVAAASVVGPDSVLSFSWNVSSSGTGECSRIYVGNSSLYQPKQ